jgi:hypothetical protein
MLYNKIISLLWLSEQVKWEFFLFCFPSEFSNIYSTCLHMLHALPLISFSFHLSSHSFRGQSWWTVAQKGWQIREHDSRERVLNSEQTNRKKKNDRKNWDRGKGWVEVRGMRSNCECVRNIRRTQTWEADLVWNFGKTSSWLLQIVSSVITYGFVQF